MVRQTKKVQLHSKNLVVAIVFGAISKIYPESQGAILKLFTKYRILDTELPRILLR